MLATMSLRYDSELMPCTVYLTALNGAFALFTADGAIEMAPTSDASRRAMQLLSNELDLISQVSAHKAKELSKAPVGKV